jgi:hypothetical protein
MSARALLCRRWPGRGELGCQVDSLPTLSLSCFGTRSGGWILSGLCKEAGTAVEPNGSLDRYCSVRCLVVLALPDAVAMMTSAGQVAWWRRADLAACRDLDRFGNDERAESCILAGVYSRMGLSTG